MDIIVKSVLNYVQNLDGHNNSIIAGGSIRDQVLGLKPKDYDIFVPSKGVKDIHELMQSIQHEFNVEDVVCKTKIYEGLQRDNPQRLTCVYGFNVEGKSFDLIGTQEEDDGDFPDIVISCFDYGINMAYDDGSTLFDTDPNFTHDVGYFHATLVNINEMHELPSAMERFNSLNKKVKETLGRELRFQCPSLTLTNKKKSEKKYYGGYEIKDNTIDEAETLEWEPTPVTPQRRSRVQDILRREATLFAPSDTATTNSTIRFNPNTVTNLDNTF